MDILAVQRRFQEAGYQWVEHIFNDGYVHNCFIAFTKRKEPSYFLRHPDGDFDWGRFSRHNCWLYAAEYLDAVEAGERKEFPTRTKTNHNTRKGKIMSNDAKVKKSKGKRTTITVCNGYHKKALEVEATVHGALAVHRTINGKGWTVTHVPIGLGFRCVRTRNEANKLLHAIEHLCDWEKVKKESDVPIAVQAECKRLYREHLSH